MNWIKIMKFYWDCCDRIFYWENNCYPTPILFILLFMTEFTRQWPASEGKLGSCGRGGGPDLILSTAASTRSSGSVPLGPPSVIAGNSIWRGCRWSKVTSPTSSSSVVFDGSDAINIWSCVENYINLFSGILWYSLTSPFRIQNARMRNFIF